MQELVLEKESRIRESMLMMGLRLFVLWTTWFIKQFVFLFISSFIVALLLKVSITCDNVKDKLYICDPLWEKVHFRANINFALSVVFGSWTDFWSK